MSLEDPGIATNESPQENATNLDNRKTKPIKPRWNGGRPEITPRRAHAIREKRDWLNAREEKTNVPFAAFCSDARFGHAIARRELEGPLTVRDVATLIAPGVREMLRRAHWVVLVAFANAYAKLGAIGVAVKYKTLAPLVVKRRDANPDSVITARRVMAELAELRLLTCDVVPTFERHCQCAVCQEGHAERCTNMYAPHSRRENAYQLSSSVLGGIAKCLLIAKRDSLPRNEQASGTEHESAFLPCSVSASAIGAKPIPDACSNSEVDVPATPATLEAGATPRSLVGQPRQGATCNAPPEAPDGVAPTIHQVLVDSALRRWLRDPVAELDALLADVDARVTPITSARRVR